MIDYYEINYQMNYLLVIDFDDINKILMMIYIHDDQFLFQFHLINL